MLKQIGLFPLHSRVRVFGKIGYVLKHEDSYTFVDMHNYCIQLPNEYLVERVLRYKPFKRKTNG